MEGVVPGLGEVWAVGQAVGDELEVGSGLFSQPIFCLEAVETIIVE